MWGKGNNHRALLLKLQISTATMDKVWSFLKKLKTGYHMIQQFYFWIYPKKTKTLIRKDTPTHTRMSIAALFTIPKYVNSLHTHSGLLLSHKKECNLAIWDNMDGPREYYVK